MVEVPASATRLPGRLGGPRREAAEAFGSSVLLQICLLASGVIAARVLGPTDRGHLALFFIVHLTIGQIGTLGTPSALTFVVARQRPGVLATARAMRRIVRTQLLVLTALDATVMLCIAGLGFAPVGPAMVSVLAEPLVIIAYYGVCYYQGADEFRLLHALRVLPALLYAAGVGAGVALGARSLMFVTLVWVASWVIGAGATILSLRLKRERDPGARTAPTQIDVPELRRFGLRGLLGSASPTETFRVDQLVVGLALSPRALGLYVAALAFTNLPRFLAQGLGLVAYPRVAGVHDRAQQRRLLWRFTALGTVAAAATAAPLIFGANALMVAAFGPDFASAATAARILLLGTILLCARRIMSDALRGAGAPEAGSRAEVISLAALIPLLAVGVPLLGIEGVAIALSGSYLVSLLALCSIASRLGLGLLPNRSGQATKPA